MKTKTLNIKMMTKHLTEALAKEVAFREKKAQRGVAVRRGQTKGEKGK
jgi:hypothetical protein